MFFKDVTTTFKQLSENFSLFHGYRVSDIGRFDFVRLSNGRQDLYMLKDEFAFVTKALNDIQNSAKNFGHKKITVFPAEGSKKPYRISWVIDEIWKTMAIPETVRIELAIRALDISPSKDESFAVHGWLHQRRDTFKTWKRIDIPVEKLIRAGFYFTGIGDAVRCFVCNGVLRNWVQGDDPFDEHKRHFPSCMYVRKIANYDDAPEVSLLCDYGRDVCGWHNEPVYDDTDWHSQEGDNERTPLLSFVQ